MPRMCRRCQRWKERFGHAIAVATLRKLSSNPVTAASSRPPEDLIDEAHLARMLGGCSGR